MKKQEECTEKECTRCHKVKKIEDFRTRPFGFTLNQCKECESEMNKERAAAKRAAKKEAEAAVVTITTKSGVVVQASTLPINGGRKAASPLSDKVLYFGPDVNRDKARLAYSVYANVVRTGITYQTV